MAKNPDRESNPFPYYPKRKKKYPLHTHQVWVWGWQEFVTLVQDVNITAGRELENKEYPWDRGAGILWVEGG